ncbi:zeatin O-glucosyltransferase-like [Rhododendron vialii]|uniref:zeatin O-glucosyltransferase-like n=1 Tax=Rhododendron vialii TaxID=182163 RepID=UPI00265E1F52|nr:zeatin O-glucosyltransferase-like [Rhododendron vialii]
MDATNIIQYPSHGAQVEVIVVPFPMHSHLDQLLRLSCLIAAHNIPVHYATTATHLRQAKLRFDSQTYLQNSNIHFHEFPTPHFLSPPPIPNSSSKFPSHLQPSFEASVHLREPTAALLREVSATARRVVVIHDYLMAYVVQDVGTLPNAESYMFCAVSVFHYSLRGMKDQNSVQVLLDQELKGIPSLEGCSTPEFQNLISLQYDFLSLGAGIIFNSCRSIEGTYIDLLAKEMNSRNKKIWAVGPLNHGKTSDRRESNSRHKCLEWLDKQVPKSVLYVSFGTVTSIADEQIKELAIGLVQSKQKFIWILRDADRGDIFAGDVKRAQLPKWYEERVKEFGLVVRDWVPQVEILGHPSTGGFMSHCGWNSCLESITMGVPIAAWPMHSDQPRNAFLVTDILKVGVAVNTWEKREEIVNSSTIARAVKSLMASKEGDETRKRVEEIGDATRLAVEEGGISRLELYSFIARITRE